jgi:hypothetical protein
MSDDLIKRLHNVRLEGVQELCWEAAYRIEESEAKLAEAEAVAKIWQEDFIQENNRWGDALRKLDKAVETLREIESITVHSGGDINGVKASAWRDAFEQAHCKACAALAELKKQ